MSLKYYKAYMDTIYKQPVDDWQELMQESINETFINTSTYRNILGQVNCGGFNYLYEELQLSSARSSKNANEWNDDWRQIIYKNYEDNRIPFNVLLDTKIQIISQGGIEYYRYLTKDGDIYITRENNKRFLGKYYIYDSSVWLVVNTNTAIGSVCSAIIRRCNNKLKWYDEEHTLHIWDCVLDKKGSMNFDYGSKGAIEVNSDAVVQVQRNEETKQIKVNQRFIFNGKGYQVKNIDDTKSNTFLTIYLFEIEIQSNDDLINNIANSNGEITPISTITKILPEIVQIPQGKTQEYSIYKYINGIPQEDTFNIVCSGAFENVNYKLTIIDGNNFTIENLLQSNIPLKITCTNNTSGEITKTKIMLVGEW